MGTSVYFNNQRATVEQRLLEDFIIESIRNHGIDVYYIPRESQSEFDLLFGDDPVKCFNNAIKLEVYLETWRDYEGNKEFYSKFGLQVAETAKLCIAQKTFKHQITKQYPEKRVPKEGDLLYLPIQYKLMEIKFVEEEKNFFQLGRDSTQPYMFSMTVEAFKYNGELLQTGITEIDRIGDVQAFNIEHTMQPGGTGTFEKFQWVYQGTNFENATARAVVSSWDKPNLILKLRNIRGEFAANVAIKGRNTDASWLLGTYNFQNNANARENVEDNLDIEREASNFLDFSEHNPFGEP